MSVLSQLTDRVAARPLPEAPVQAVIAPVDEDEGEGVSLGYAEGQSFLIEYRDAKGVVSRRRITVWGLTELPSGVPGLYARCHERKAMRTFRADRILCCIDYDGEVFDDVPAFLNENFGMALDRAAAKADIDDDGWAAMRAAIRNDAVLLNAMAHSDGVFRNSEVAEAVQHLAMVCERRDMFTDAGALRRIERYFRRLRPTGEALKRALASLPARSASDVRWTVMAAAKVMDADGRRAPEETALLNLIAQESLGITLF